MCPWPARKVLATLLAALGLSSEATLFAQAPRQIESSFRQEFNTYEWNWRLRVEQSWPAGGRLFIHEGLTSSLLSLGGDVHRWKDDHRLSAEWWRALRGNWRIGTGARALRYWDRQSGFANDYSDQELFVGLEAQPWPNVLTKAEVGPRRDVRYAHRDWGGGWVLTTELRGTEWGDYRHQAELNWNRDDLGPRRNEDLRFSYRLGRVFEAGTSDSLEVRWDRFRRDNYVNEMLDLERFTESTFVLGNRFHYSLSRRWLLFLRTAYRNARIDVTQTRQGAAGRSRKRTEADFQNRAQIRYDGSGKQMLIEILYRSAATRYRLPEMEVGTPFSRRLAFVAPDNRLRLLSWILRGGLEPTSSDSLGLTARISRLQYDTPDTSNFDDHDELRLDFVFSWKRHLSQYLKAFLKGGVGLYHLVYIFGDRSADNRWNRVFRLSPAVEVRPSRNVRLMHRFEALANYTDYDFEEMLEATRSFVYRRFLAEDSLRVAIGRRYSVLAVVRKELEENGRLYWDDFEERPLTGRDSWRLRFYLERRLGNWVRLGLGFSYYERKEDRFVRAQAGGYRRARAGTFISRGPLLSLIIWKQGTSFAQAYLHRQRVNTGSAPVYFVNTIELTVHWGF